MAGTGRRVEADTAERWGLVSEVVDKGAAVDAALALAQEVAEKSPQAVRLSKRLIRDAQVSTLENALSMGSMAQAVVTGSPDQREAVAALIGKRPAKFGRSEEHTSELQSLMRISYAVFCLKKKKIKKTNKERIYTN